MTDEEPKKDKVSVVLKREFSLDDTAQIIYSKPTIIVDDKNNPILKDGQPQYEPGVKLFKQEDISSLFNLVNAYDTNKHPGAMKGFRQMLSIKDKLEMLGRKTAEGSTPEPIKDPTAVITNELNLTIEEGAWLKNYLETIMINEYKDKPMHQFHIRTLVSVLDQLS